MYHYRVFLTLCTLVLMLTATAQQRTKAQMQQRAQQVLSQLGVQAMGQPMELKHTPHYRVYGYERGGYAILSESSLLPDVIGYSDTPFNDQTNPNLAWYLAQIDTLAAQVAQRGVAVQRAQVDTSRFPSSVPSLVTSTWGQEAPYWNLCPVDPVWGSCYTGCVATAMAQVLYYHKYPPQGQGQRTITYPLEGNNVKATVTANFGETQYDWNHMRDSYSGTYTAQEAEAVATLMMHCGVAARMNYSTSGSGTYTADAAYGLREYFGISTARAYYRTDYVSSDWMDMIYTELSEHRPIVYGATDRQQGFGHAFVFDGYNAQGQVHVNWGWDGDANGYYDVSILNPQIYNFNDDHDMITGIYGKPMELQTATVHVAEPGLLATTISEEAAVEYAELTVTGTINGSDLRRLRFMAGRDEQGHPTAGNLRKLDLSSARIVSGGEAFLSENGAQYLTAADELPPHAFYACQTLESLILPSGLKRWGEAALAMCLKLDEVQIAPPAADAEFVVDGEVVYDLSKTRVLAVLPGAKGRLKLPVGVTTLGAYALAGCNRLTSLSLPSTLTALEQSALYYCTGLTELRLYALAVPSIGQNALGSIDAEKCQLAVRRDMTTPYLQSSGFNIFTRNIREFYTIIRPRNATREYGDENPLFGYQLEGDDVEGEPLIESEATLSSPAGRYAITATLGTIDDEAVEFGEGTLIVRKAPLTVRPADVERGVGEANPVFTLLYEGLKNEETEPLFTTVPTITTEANEQSPEGEYVITVSGGESPCYSLSYQTGTLTVSSAVSQAVMPISQTAVDATHPVYDLQGHRVADSLSALWGSHRLSKGVYICQGKKIIVK